MSEKPQSSGFRAPRGPAIVASIGAGMLVTAMVGALMLFAPSGGNPSASPAPTTSSAKPEAEAKVDTGRQVTVSRELPKNAAQGARKVVVETVAPAPAPQPQAHPPQTRAPRPAPAPAPRDDRDHHRSCRDRDGDGHPDRWCLRTWQRDWDNGHDGGGWWRDHGGDGWTDSGGNGGWGGGWGGRQR